MKSFLDEIIKYLENGYKIDNSFAKKPLGHYAYEFNLKPSTEPYFEIQALSSADNEDDFYEVSSSSVDIQINLYGVKTKINNEIATAQECAMLLADKCEKIMTVFKNSSDNVIRMNKTIRSPAIPFDDGSKAYTIAIRYSIILNNN